MPIQSRLGKKMDLKIERLGINGEGVSQWYGCTIFVDGALPGEEVKASLYEKKKTYGRARVLDIVSSSPDRQEPICLLFGKCGGCQVMHLSYERQLIEKRQRVVDALERIGKFKDIDVKDCAASPSPLHYRNKIQIPVVSSQDGISFGLYARGSHDLIEMSKCHIHCSLGESVFHQMQGLLKKSSLAPYNFQTGEGEIRHLLIKTAVATNQVLVVLVSAKKPSEELLALSNEILEKIPSVKGVVHNLNQESSNTVLGSCYTTLAGHDAIEEILCGLKFNVSPASFFQVNPPQAERLYKAAISAADVSSEEVVLDAYCGVGTMSLMFSKHVKKVIGVEAVAQAIEDAKSNADRNNIVNVEFHADLVENFIENFSEDIDVVLLNPPRRGCELSVLEKISSSTASKIVYVSCDPATLARDLQILSQKGWMIESVEPFDMFPQTSHVETLVSIRRIS